MERLWKVDPEKGVLYMSSQDWPSLNKFNWVKVSEVAQSCLTLWDSMNSNTQGSLSITNSQGLPKLMSIELVMPSNHPVVPFSCLQSFPTSGSIQRSQLFTSGGQNIGVSASTSPWGLQHARLPCPSTIPGACSNSCPSSQWCSLMGAKH